MKHIVLLSCTKKKLPYATSAKRLYSASPLFRLSLAYAKQLRPDAIYILSAKYGLVELDQEIAPYEKTLLRMDWAERAAWGRRVLDRLWTLHSLTKDRYTFLAGSAYSKPLVASLRHVALPLSGMGQGKRLQFLKQQTTPQKSQRGFWA